MKVTLCIYLLVSLLFIIWHFVKKNELEIMPTIIWVLLMGLSMLVQFDTFPTKTASIQLFGIIFIGICLMIGDGWQPRRLLLGASHDGWHMLSDYKIYVFLFVGLAIYHLLLLEHIPLLEKFIGGGVSDTTLVEMREQASKLLQVPTLLKHVFNWNIKIIGVLAFCLLLKSSKYVLAALFFICVCLYTVMDLSKCSIVLFIASLMFILLWRFPFRKRLYVYISMLLIFILMGITVGVFSLGNPKENFDATHIKTSQTGELRGQTQQEVAQNLPLTYGDRHRLKPDVVSKDFNYFLDYILYRVFLVPAEVSSKWYQFYSQPSESFSGLDGLLPGTRGPGYVHPARRVGNWAYTKRFPEKYLDTVHAYASIDADAYGRFGIFGIIVVGLLVVFMRIIFKYLRNNTPLALIMYPMSVMCLSMLLPMASIQAILVAHGFLLIGAMLYISKNGFRVIWWKQ